MALPFAAVALLLAASDAAAMPPSVKGICANKEKSVVRRGHEFVTCGLTRCNGDVGSCDQGRKAWISWSFIPESKVGDCESGDDSCVECREECVETSGAVSAATASDSDTVAVPEDTDGDAEATSEDGGDEEVAATGGDDDDDMDMETGGEEPMEDGDAPVATTDGGDETAKDAETTTTTMGGGDETAEDDDVADEDATATTTDGEDAAGGEEIAAVCNSVVDALMMLDAAAASALADVAQKALDPATVATLLDPAANLTVFVPPNEAVLKLVGGIESGALALDDVGAILRLHLVPEPLSSEMIIEMEGELLPTLLGEDDMLLVGTEGDAVSLTANNTVLITAVDLDGCSDSQILHRIDGLLIPEGMDIDVDALPVGDITAIEALPPAGGTPLEQDRGVAVAESGAAGVAGALAAAALSAVALLAL